MKLLQNQTLFFIPANSKKGFNFGYFIKINCNNPRKKLQLIGECNNTQVSDNLEETIAKCEWEIKNNGLVARRLQHKLENSAWIFPCFIRHQNKESNINTHSLTSMAISTKRKEIKRVDKQFLCMINDAKKQLKKEGYLVSEKIIMTGFSSSAKFAQRWTLLYPEQVQYVIAGGSSALLCLPLCEYQNQKLNFPLGINNYKQLTGHNFDKKTYYKIPHYMFLGEKDTNDPVPYTDCYTDEERKIIHKIFGKDMQKERFENSQELIKELKLTNQHLYKIKGIGHAPQGIFEILEAEKINLMK